METTFFHNYRDPAVEVCIGTRTSDAKLPGIELGITEHIAKKLHCLRTHNAESVDENVRSWAKDGKLLIQGGGGISFWPAMAALCGAWDDPVVRSKATTELSLRVMQEGCVSGRGWPIWPSYPRAAIGARQVAGAARFNPVAKLAPGQDILEMTIDSLRDVGPGQKLPVLNWIFEYLNPDGVVKDFEEQPFTVESVYPTETAEKPEIRPVKEGTDLAMIVVDHPFGDTGIKFGVDIGGRGGGTVGGALWHQHLVDPSDSETVQSFVKLFTDSVKREPNAYDVFRFARSIEETTAMARQAMAPIDAEGVTGAILVIPIRLENGMPVEYKQPVHGFKGSDAWIKRDGKWRMMSAS